MPISPFEAFRSGTKSLRQGDKAKALVSLEYAAERGLTVARWKLARMYQEGDGVDRSDLRAFEYFSSIVEDRADDPRNAPEASFVSSAFVALGNYYRTGIPDTTVKSDPQRARRTYYHAATYFGDPEAQYHYARMLYDGTGGPKDFRRAAQWFHSSANKGQYKAQAMLGRILFKGETGVPRQPPRGLMWLALAQANAPASEKWITEHYEAALKQATEEERGSAAEMLMQWMNAPRRDH
jgi:TPR repeat protein